MLPWTIKMLKAQEADFRAKKISHLTASGQESDDGDADDSEFFRLAHAESQIAEFLEKTSTSLLAGANELQRPGQNVTVQLGHMVKVRLLDDPDAVDLGIKETIIHLLSTADAQVLNKVLANDSRFTDRVSQLIVSIDSPLGQALVGRERGETFTYQGGHEEFRARVLRGNEAIEATYFFDGVES